MTTTVEVVLDSKAELGEGPIWHAQKQQLYWVNILAGQVNIFDPARQSNQIIDVGQYVGTVVPRRSGGVMLAVHHGFAALDLDSEALTIVNDPEANIPTNRFNDGKCDPVGRFWAGTMSLGEDRTEKGSLYRLDVDLTAHKMLDKVSVSNGIAWSLDNKTMYYIDTPTQCVFAFDYDLESGDISNRRVAIEVPKEMGFPDGSTLDAEGMLWIAHWQGYRVTRWDPTSGKLLQTIKVPAPQVTACAFGGPKLDQLYITSARVTLSEATLADYPHAGGLFVCEPGVQGIEAVEFGG